jgi:hypothetical protein
MPDTQDHVRAMFLKRNLGLHVAPHDGRSV